ncbi:hypothetical protein KA012_00045 [Candidatus Woesebacteria bacterium]|nr:hypothetical protein [Candidatus Woesebacteria bacterium]
MNAASVHNRWILKIASSLLVFLCIFIPFFLSTSDVYAQTASCAGGGFNMLQYLQGDGSQSLHTTTDEYYTTLNGIKVNGKNGFYIVKNRYGNVYEEFTYDSEYIYHLKDTSWATEQGNVQCNGHDAGFTLLDGCISDQQEAGQKIGTAEEGSKWFPVCMQKDKEYAFETTVTAFDKTTCQACTAQYTGCATRKVKIVETNINGQITLPDGQKSVELKDAIRVAITEGPGANENYIYDPKYGWVGFGRSDQMTSVTHEIVPKIAFDTPQMCSEILGTGLKQVAPEKYYIQPINGISSIVPTKLTQEPEAVAARALNKAESDNRLDVIRDELIMQGYEARCAAPVTKIVLTLAGRDAIKKLFEQPDPKINGVIMGAEGVSLPNRLDKTNRIFSLLDVDYRDILVPLFRDLDLTDPTLKRSIEDYFGFKEVNDTVYPSAELKTAAIHSLLSSEQQCTVAYQNLLAQETMCQKLADPNLCALYSTSIPNTTYTVRTLYQAFETARGSATAVDYCRTLMASNKPADAKLRTGMSHAPLTIEKAYRLAFLVTSVQLRNPVDGILNMFTHPFGGWNAPPKPNHGVLVTAFKVPDLLTNKGFNDGYTLDTAYEDVGTLTKNSLITQPAQTKIEEQALERRRLLLEKARVLSTVVQDKNWAEISCLGGFAKTLGVGSEQCKDPLSKALIDIINAQVVLDKEMQNQVQIVNLPSDPSGTSALAGLLAANETDRGLVCEPIDEKAPVINDPGVINSPSDPSHVFSENWGAALLANLFSDCTHQADDPSGASHANTKNPDSKQPCVEDYYLKSRYYVIDPDHPTASGQKLLEADPDDYLAIKQYLVYPMGYELSTVEGVLAGSFFSKQQLADVLDLQQNDPSDSEKMAEQFQLENAKTQFTGGKASYSFTDVNNCKTVTHTENGVTKTERVCATESFSYQPVVNKQEIAGILGAKLGYWMRKIQLTLNSTTQESYAYLKTCSNLEEFLLNRCSGTGSPVSTPPPGGSGSAGIIGQCTSTTSLAEIKYDQPTQLPAEGQATYYGKGKFYETLNSRLSGWAGHDFVGNTTVKNCELEGETLNDARLAASAIGQQYVGCVAMLRVGDLEFRTAYNQGSPDPNKVRTVWLKRWLSPAPDATGQRESVIHGPFAVIDVAASTDAPCLYDRNWVVDIDYNSFDRLFGQTAGPDSVVVCDTSDC